MSGASFRSLCSPLRIAERFSPSFLTVAALCFSLAGAAQVTAGAFGSIPVGQTSAPVQTVANSAVAAAPAAVAPASAGSSLDASALHQAAITSLMNEGLLAA